LEYKIFNRFGEELFSTNNPLQKWDGKSKGLDAELGIYYYTIQYVTVRGKTKHLQGDILLLR
jgi:gliding motility-associated-like protein